MDPLLSAKASHFSFSSLPNHSPLEVGFIYWDFYFLPPSAVLDTALPTIFRASAGRHPSLFLKSLLFFSGRVEQRLQQAQSANTIDTRKALNDMRCF